MPTQATTHIQKMAPGPPMSRAAATPKTLPTPTRAANEMAKAWKEEIPPLAPPLAPPICRTISGRWRTWTPRETTVRNEPAAMRTHMVM